MNDPKKTTNPVFNPGKARWLQERGTDELTGDQQALLLAMTQLEAELGRELSPEEQEAMERMASELDGFDPKDIVNAVQKMVSQPADPKRKTSWPELKRRK